MNEPTIPELIVKWRKQRGMSQVEVAEWLGIDRKTILRWENGHTTMTVPELRTLTDLYGVDWREPFRLTQRVEAIAEMQHDDLYSRIRKQLHYLNVKQLRAILYMVAMLLGKQPDEV
jgi:transcriptional regulator with XRE-family HTH domain